MSDETNIIKSSESQPEPAHDLDYMHLAGLAPERWFGLSAEDREKWIAKFHASGLSRGYAEATQGRRRK
ncbi:hypothetical protein A1351_23220 [Methylosinus sp. R-45379]|uniref:hypothetical protein n=1 Tax=Methylosinus sp. R-45379 TaxID=980563 RepID=UPI0007C8E6D4|nr:hypothetical protein [Methylosinus sp. R-45379]OAI29933.1 hypothetical protein A1351_23220 [Methylosinus sp. R-45379]